MLRPIPGWSLAESIMENIIGSAYEFTYTEDPIARRITFRRFSKPLTNGLWTFISPARRDRAKQRTDGLWEPIKP